MYSLSGTLSPELRQQPETVRRAAEVDRFMRSDAFRKEFAEIRQNVGYLAKEGKRREDQGLEEKKQREFDTKIRGMQETCRFFNELGAQTGNAGMQTVAAAAFAGTELYAAGTALASSIASNGFMSMATLHPVAMAATAALTIFGLCRRKKRKGPDFSQVFMENMRIISQQIHDLHVETRTMRQENFEMHQHLLESMHQGFIHLEESFHADMESLEATMTTYMQRIESNLNQWGKVIAYRQNVTSLQEFRKVMHRMDNWLEGREKAHPEAKIPKIANQASEWLKINGTTALPMYTGLDLIPNGGIDFDRHIVDVIFPQVDANIVAERRGFLGFYAKEQLNLPIETDYTSLFDPTVWLPMAMSYVDFRAAFGKKVLDPDCHNLDAIKQAAKVNTKYIHEMRQNSSALFQKLFAQYQEALDEVNQIIHHEIDQYQSVNIRESAASKINALKGQYPQNQVVKGGTRYCYYGPNQFANESKSYWGSSARTNLEHILVLGLSGANRDSYMQAYYGTAVDFTYNEGIIRPHEFPAEFLVLEKMKLGSISHSYTADYKKPTETEDYYSVVLSGASPKHSSRCVTVKFTYAATGQERQMMQINQELISGKITKQQISFIDKAQEEAKEYLTQHILSLRLAAVKTALAKIEQLSPKLDALMRLILAYAIEMGCNPQDIIALKEQLLTNSQVVAHLKSYLNSATIDTPLPAIDLNSLSISHSFIGKLKQPEYFHSVLEDGLQSVVHALEVLRSEETLRRSVGLDEDAETKKAEYYQGYELGNAFALSMIVAALQAAGHSRAAQRLSADNPDVFQIENQKIDPKVKEGMLQSVSIKIMELVPKIIVEEQQAAMWLLTFASTKIRAAIESQKPLMITDVIGQSVVPLSSKLARLSMFASGSSEVKPDGLTTDFNTQYN